MENNKLELSKKELGSVVGGKLDNWALNLMAGVGLSQFLLVPTVLGTGIAALAKIPSGKKGNKKAAIILGALTGSLLIADAATIGIIFKLLKNNALKNS